MSKVISPKTDYCSHSNYLALLSNALLMTYSSLSKWGKNISLLDNISKTEHFLDYFKGQHLIAYSLLSYIIQFMYLLAICLITSISSNPLLNMKMILPQFLSVFLTISPSPFRCDVLIDFSRK